MRGRSSRPIRSCLRQAFAQLREHLAIRDIAARGLYKATDGSWRQADARTGVRLLYRLKESERWTLLDKDRAIVVHPNQPPKIIHPDGRVEGMGANVDA